MQMNASDLEQYPPPRGLYKVSVKNKGIWRGHNTARLQISMNNPRHTGDKFFALTEWAAARFDKVILIISDTLQRHNTELEYGVSHDEARKISLMSGDQWLKDNQAALANLKPWQRVDTRWDDWLKHKDFDAAHREICRLYNTSSVFADSIITEAERFCRHYQDKSSSVRQRYFDASITYILEEIAAFAIMFKETPAVDIYPGLWFTNTFRIITEMKDIPPPLTGFSNAACLSIDFVRNKAVQLNDSDHLRTAA
jgi:tRNA-dependent cyclodipeptide synthase